MPVVNSKKYSCEPCIRGHRATKCMHTNRLLVLVRKPGRPMQSCAHELEGCVCGRLGGAGEDWGVDGPTNMSKSVGYDARESFNVTGTMGSEESRKHVSRTESKKRKRKAKEGGISDVQRNKVNKRAKGPTSSSRKTSSPSPKCPVPEQQEATEYSSNIKPELILDPKHPKISITSSISVPAISNFLPPIRTLIPQVPDHNLVAPQTSYTDHSPSCIFHHHQQQNDKSSFRMPLSSPFLRYY
ncbi:uncharacterized protein EAF02_001340 [Botrytis sinoallii]|uniref:uncharacterized protein n=1 Tax=Botrytis sinoallii TaxID=1463999 RepID=UPI0019011E0D|nr:uncharacterized protein EAF02_001340 [Botrytis sinoallii]KAF7891015.1 hypothetical protein EAF02_001340 [Botrytis sinoallii]